MDSYQLKISLVFTMGQQVLHTLGQLMIDITIKRMAGSGICVGQP